MPLPGVALHAGDEGIAVEVAVEFLHILGETLGGAGIAAQGAQCHLVGAGCAAETKVDAARVKLGEGAELFGDDQRGVVRQHHSAGAQVDGFGMCADVCDQHRRGGAGDGLHVVVLGIPNAPVAEALGVLSPLHGSAESIAGALALVHGCEVNEGQWDGQGAFSFRGPVGAL